MHGRIQCSRVPIAPFSRPILIACFLCFYQYFLLEIRQDEIWWGRRSIFEKSSRPSPQCSINYCFLCLSRNGVFADNSGGRSSFVVVAVKMSDDTVPDDLTPAEVGYIPAQKTFTIDGAPVTFPLVLTPGAPEPETQMTAFVTTDAVAEWVARNRRRLADRAQRHGALLLRGFCPPVRTAADFDTVCRAFGLDVFPYVGGAAPRTVVSGSVFTANESPADQLIPFHHEMAQSRTHPGTLFFYCRTPPAEGGETPIVLSHLVYERVRAEFPGFVDALEEKGVRYVRVLPEEDDPSSAIGRGWKSTFAVQTQEEAEEVGRAMGMELEWLEGGQQDDDSSNNNNNNERLLKTTTAVMPATKRDPRAGGKTAWFNSIVAAFTGWKDQRNDPRRAVVFGDGSPLDAEVLGRCLEIMNELAVAFRWERGDILVVDNWVTLHSRNSFKGERLIYASLWK